MGMSSLRAEFHYSWVEAVALEDGSWLAHCHPPRKGHLRPPNVVQQAYIQYTREGWSFSLSAGIQQGRRTPWLHGKCR